LFTEYLLPFEAVSILLLVAVVGAVVLAKTKLD
jgi:NADH-quinone oxidoreductase subunit J